MREHRFLFANNVLRRIFRPKRGKVTGGWIKLHSEELYNLNFSPDIIAERGINIQGMCPLEEIRNAYEKFIGNPEQVTPWEICSLEPTQ
jgi:hypothetical protein